MTLTCGDWLPTLADLDPGSVGLVLTDPPYANTKHAWDSPVDWSVWWPQVWRVLRPGGAAVVFSQGLMSADLMVSARKQYRHTLIWETNTVTGQLNANRAPLRAHQDVLVFCRTQPTYHPQMWHGAPSHRARRAQSDPGQFYGQVTYHDQEPGNTLKFPRSVQRFDRVHVRHSVVPSQKPVDLLRWLVRTYSDPGDLVLDCFAGSGSTGEAARAEGRPYHLVERDPDRCRLIQERLFT